MGGLSPWVSLREQGAFQSGLRGAVREPERLAGRLAPSVSGRSRTLPRRDMCGPMFSCGVRLCVQPSKARVSGVLRIAPRPCGGRNRALWRCKPHVEASPAACGGGKGALRRRPRSAAVETARCGGTNRTGRHLRREKLHGSARLWACGCRNNSIRMPISPPQHCRGNRRRGKLHPTGGEPHTRREKQRRPRDTFAARAGDTTPTRRIGTPARQLRPSTCGHGRPATVAAPSQLTSRFRMPRHPLTRR